ncbi:MAG: hypothetical protein RLY43_2157 [Bacteroidota bacterium]|jgi:uncharacterized membrane protein
MITCVCRTGDDSFDYPAYLKGVYIKLLVRVLFVFASLSMTIANWHGSYSALMASILFLVGNMISLVYNFRRTSSEPYRRNWRIDK